MEIVDTERAHDDLARSRQRIARFQALRAPTDGDAAEALVTRAGLKGAGAEGAAPAVRHVRWGVEM